MIDVGCADGHLFLHFKQRGLIPGAVPLHIDANSLYEQSLKTIKEVVGGDYRITAISDRVGEIEFTQSVHPYWSSLRAEGDLYWTRVNNLAQTKVVLPTTTLDALATELGVVPPFLLKLDVQGAELRVLSGATKVLANTHVVICEADIADFQDINRALIAVGFDLYDLTALNRISDGTLGWFYPIYVSRKFEEWRPQAFWEKGQNDAIVRLQVERREAVLRSNAAILNSLKFQNTKVSRNDPCPCGSGQRFKHCCGHHDP
jgi:FkbM family methyltransferase